MDADQFDALSRSWITVRSRRRTLALAVSASLSLLSLAHPDDAAAKKKKPCPPCKKRKQGKCKGKQPDGTACPGGTCQDGSCCLPEPQATTCASGCGTRTTRCGQVVTCPCPSGQNCLINGGCGIPCTVSCPSTCFGCPGSPNTEGQLHCIAGGTCTALPRCTTTTDCGRGSQCQNCPPGNRCVPLCAV